MVKFACLVTKVGTSIRTGQWWIHRLQSGNTEGIRGLDYKRKGMITSIGTITQVSIKFRDKKKENNKMGKKHRTQNRTASSCRKS